MSIKSLKYQEYKGESRHWSLEQCDFSAVNLVVGKNATGKTRLISGLIPAICKQLNLEASKVAYVFADQINGKNIADIVRKMSGGFLVIENANQLTKETVNQLNKAMEFRTDGLIVIIEDEKIGMRKLIARFPKFAKKFTSMINIPVFTNDELVNFARVYTKENGYKIDQMGMLATVINSLALSMALKSAGIDAELFTSTAMEPYARYYVRDKAVEFMQKGGEAVRTTASPCGQTRF